MDHMKIDTEGKKVDELKSELKSELKGKIGKHFLLEWRFIRTNAMTIAQKLLAQLLLV